MPKLTINGVSLEFEKGQSIIDIALKNGIEIPHYCYHPALSVPANCRICLAEISQPNPRTGNLELIPKLMPTCHTAAVDGMVVTTESPKAVANQKAVMEFLLINHPVDCAVCDQAGECKLQDYSHEIGRGESRFDEDKIKNPKKDVGPHVLLYSDRCIMCTRCVRFTEEVTKTAELMVEGRGGTEMIDVFPGVPLDNELSGNVVDLCPVGALLDKDFLFKQRVWFLKRAASVDGLTASGDNIWIEHNEGRVYRVKPRENPSINQWWITDEVRYGWKFVHSDSRLTMPAVRGTEAFDPARPGEAWSAAIDRATSVMREGAKAGRLALLASPMLSCEDAWSLARAVLAIDPSAVLGIGPVPVVGADRTLDGGFTISAEKAPNARGVRRVLDALAKATPSRTTGPALDAGAFLAALTAAGAGTVVASGNYPSDWVTDELFRALSTRRLVLIDTLSTRLTPLAEVTLPGATWIEKDGCFEGRSGCVQCFTGAVPPAGAARPEFEVGIALLAHATGVAHAGARSAAALRASMLGTSGLAEVARAVEAPAAATSRPSDMPRVALSAIS